MKHFVLIHGSCHGAWCWYKLATLLNSSGHNVTALDMAACGVNTRQTQQVQSFSDYAEPLVTFMASLPPEERVILVGHSFGGLIISIAMERFPERIAAAVFATAFMPGPALSFMTIAEEITRTVLDLMDSQYAYNQGANNSPTSLLMGPKFLSSSVYQLSPPEDLTLALSLVRSSPVLSEELVLSKERYGSVPRAFILCDQDYSIKESVQSWMIKN